MNSPVLMSPNVRGVAPLENDVGPRPLSAVSIDLVLAIGFVVILALLAVETGPDLGADADALALLDGGHLWADFDRPADDF